MLSPISYRSLSRTGWSQPFWTLPGPWGPTLVHLLQTPRSQACQQPTPQPLVSETRFPSFPLEEVGGSGWGRARVCGAGWAALLLRRASLRRALAGLVQGGFIPGTPLDTLTPLQPQGTGDGSCQMHTCCLGLQPISAHVGGCWAPHHLPPGLSCDLNPRSGCH